MSTMTKTAGYPVHAVQAFVRWTNPYEVSFTDWLARCGARDTKSGHGPFGTAGSARQAELCPVCFPVGHNSAKDGEPKELTDRADLENVGVTA